jgi:hypothetical protein
MRKNIAFGSKDVIFTLKTVVPLMTKHVMSDTRYVLLLYGVILALGEDFFVISGTFFLLLHPSLRSLYFHNSNKYKALSGMSHLWHILCKNKVCIILFEFSRKTRKARNEWIFQGFASLRALREPGKSIFTF